MSPSPTDTIALFSRGKPNKIAATDLISQQSWTYKQLDSTISYAASALIDDGFQTKDCLAVLAQNSVEQVILHYACSRAGLIFAPLNWRLSAAEIASYLAVINPKRVFTDATNSELVPAHLPQENIARFFQTLGQTKKALPQKPTLDLDRPSLYLQTSGSSGKAKTVVLSERNIMMSGVNFAAFTSVDQNSCFLCDAPMFHTIGIVANIRSAFHCGGSIMVSDGFKAPRTLRWLSNQSLGISHYVGVPQMIEAFKDLDEFKANSLTHLTAIVTGGAVHRRSDMQFWLDNNVPLARGYGMSETGSVFGTPPDLSLLKNKIGSVGIATPWMEIQVVNEQGNNAAVNEKGELWIRGKNIALGYLNASETDEQSFRQDGWFKTGDIFHYDKDGFFWLVGRKKDMYISAGENIYPAEIENVLSEYSGLKEYAVLGVADEKWGEVGCIMAVTSDKSRFNKEQLFTFLRSRIARFKIPKHVFIVDALPKTSGGKLFRAELKALAEELLAKPNE